jgi:hypothetical protein
MPKFQAKSFASVGCHCLATAAAARLQGPGNSGQGNGVSVMPVWTKSCTAISAQEPLSAHQELNLSLLGNAGLPNEVAMPKELWLHHTSFERNVPVPARLRACDSAVEPRLLPS